MSGDLRPRDVGSQSGVHGICYEVLDRAFEYIDGELSALDCERIRQHLLDCAPCMHEYTRSEHLKALVRRSCGCDSAPLELRQKVLMRITEVRTTFGP